MIREASRLRHFCEKGLLIFIISAIVFFPLRPAHAENQYKWMETAIPGRAFVVPSCSLYVEPLLFPDLSPTTGDVISYSFFRIACTFASNWTITMDIGQNERDGHRRMKHESKYIFIPYELRANPLSGQGQGGKYAQFSDVAGILKSTDFASVPPGNYSDTVIVTLTSSVGY